MNILQFKFEFFVIEARFFNDETPHDSESIYHKNIIHR